jgi:hypothetical protein
MINNTSSNEDHYRGGCEPAFLAGANPLTTSYKCVTIELSYRWAYLH